MIVLFWFVLFLLIYSFIAYPLMLVVLAAALGHRKYGYHDSELPRVMFAFACAWEGKRLEAKIRNCLELDYPREKLDIVAISDAATTETLEVLRRAESKGVIRLLHNPRRSGKSAALARALEICSADVFVVTDADALLEPGHLARMVEPFANPKIGATTSLVHYANVGESGISRNEGLYWQFEFITRKAESLLGKLTGLSGAFYAVRPELFKISNPNLDADFLAPLQVIENRKDVLLLEDVSAEDYTPSSSQALFARRVRTITLGLWSLARNLRYLSPFRFPLLSWELWSHKIMRWLLPVFMLLILASNAFLISKGLFWQALLACQILFYLAGLAGGVAARFSMRVPLLSSVWYFLVSAWASLVAFFNLLRGKDYAVWSETAQK